VGEREERIGRNEALFRDLNERTTEIAASLTPGQPPRDLEILCECGQMDCIERIAISVPEYEQARANPERFIVASGHEILDAEDIISTGDGYSVVEKHGKEAAIARQTDPRS
jgi:hypothetical protein